MTVVATVQAATRNLVKVAKAAAAWRRPAGHNQNDFEHGSDWDGERPSTSETLLRFAGVLETLDVCLAIMETDQHGYKNVGRLHAERSLGRLERVQAAREPEIEMPTTALGSEAAPMRQKLALFSLETLERKLNAVTKKCKTINECVRIPLCHSPTMICHHHRRMTAVKRSFGLLSSVHRLRSPTYGKDWRWSFDAPSYIGKLSFSAWVRVVSSYQCKS